MKPKICVSLFGKTINDVISMVQRAEKKGADFVEIRMDYLNSEDWHKKNLERIVKKATIPLIATNRQFNQGGYRPIKEEFRILSLIKASELGFQYVDLELTTTNLESVVREVKNNGTKSIVSFHDFKGTPSNYEMEMIIDSQIKAGAEVCKIVTTASCLEDNIRCLLFIYRTSEKKDLVCFAMGSKGVLSRILSPLFGAFFTFSSLERDLKTSSGQLPVAEMKELYNKLRVNN